LIKPLEDFVSRFGTKLVLDETLITKKQSRYFLLNQNLKPLVSEEFVYAGTYLGSIRHGKFLPSFDLLDMIAEKKANKITVDKKTEWLFICGRDVFRQGIVKTTGSTDQNDYVLVVNSYGECLGFAKILRMLDQEMHGLVAKNMLDIGDFLRRERCEPPPWSPRQGHRAAR